MGCGEYAVNQVLVGLHRVGIIGLQKACDAVASSGLNDREEIVDALLHELKAENFVTAGILDEYRTALWREYLRRQGRDFSEFFSSLRVTVRGRPGEARDELVGLCRSVLADFELQPELDLDSTVAGDDEPELVIGDATVARGIPTRKALKGNIRRRLSDW
jgi:hypothetical protein